MLAVQCWLYNTARYNAVRTIHIAGAMLPVRYQTDTKYIFNLS